MSKEALVLNGTMTRILGVMELWSDGIMGKINKNIVRYIAILLIAAFAFVTGCMTVPGGPGMMGGQFVPGERNTFITHELGNLWTERTIRLNPVNERGSGSSFMGGGGPGGMRGTFPLNASATLIDSALADYGLEEFAGFADMNESEKILYKAKYKEVNKMKENIYVWLDLKTSYSKDLLNIDNWSIFFEDDKGNQFDPVNIVEIPEKELPGDFRVRRNDDINNHWQMSSKVLQLYFPKKRADGSLLINKNIDNIKLVMFNWSNNARYEGMWHVDPEDNNSVISTESSR